MQYMAETDIKYLSCCPMSHVVFWADSGLTASVRASINSCRLGRSERLAVAANLSAVELVDMLR